jgi:hypothetical protein
MRFSLHYLSNVSENRGHLYRGHLSHKKMICMAFGRVRNAYVWLIFRPVLSRLSSEGQRLTKNYDGLPSRGYQRIGLPEVCRLRTWACKETSPLLPQNYLVPISH